MSKSDYDLCVIGGGINGVGVARDAAGRGLSVLLVESGDLAQGTSSVSTKLIHGGLRYLEFLEFRLVRDSLKERRKLLNIAPHIIWPMDFILPHSAQQRPLWMIRLGLFLYDHLARRGNLQASQLVDFREQEDVGAPLMDAYEQGFCYADCWADDARLVALNALDAAERGADIKTRTKCVGLAEHGGCWSVTLQDQMSDEIAEVRASMVVNAAGPWVRDVIESAAKVDNSAVPHVRLVKGSHIIIDRAYEGEHAYILQQDDKRIVFAIPYERDYTLVGTTEEVFEGDLYDVRASDDEINYLCAAFSKHFKQKIARKDVLWTYSGVRPLFDDGEAEARKGTRDFVLYPHREVSLPMISIFGGKLTTYRIVAEQVVNQLLHLDSRYSNPWTDEEALPGGDIADGDFETFFAQQIALYKWMPEDILYRYARSYGTRMKRFLDGAKSKKDLGRHFGDGLYEAEILYLVHYEWARTSEDILFRRTKMGLHVSEKTIEKLEKALPKIVKEVGR